MSLVQKVALVAGGGRGIGAAAARLLAANGTRVIIAYRQNSAAAEELVKTIRGTGSEAIALQADVRSKDNVVRLLEQAQTTYGPVNILISNAPANAHPKPLQQMNWEDFLQPVADELKAAFTLTQAVLPAMIDQRWGRLVFTASNLGKQPGFPGGSAIGTGKAGLIAFTKYVAQEFGSYGITANAVAPGMVETELSAQVPPVMRQQIQARTPLGRLAQAEDIAHVIAFLASEESGFMTGSCLPVSGGMAMD